MGNKKISGGLQDGEIKPEETSKEENGEEILPKEAEGIPQEKVEASEILNKEDLKKENRTLKRKVFRGSIFTGPLPPPEIFEKYEKVCPGAADRIICMAEKQMNHRHSLEEKFLDSSSRNSIVGIISALIVSITVIVVGGVCIVKGYSISGTIFGGMGIATIVTTFLRNTKMKNEKYDKDVEVDDNADIEHNKNK
ncbi:DUF2335 domain-containing protein [Clostridium kluyveri]|uniref:DUF2335 domain-containing protein n=2 Tax=Clostridium kluyveri TaxID=1534 RepID=A5MYJ0_CLOK5|nr:DUF2335 domain-containing protein [Clostridium kluyveri]EDK33936.1 Conserved hypothetical protein [Clostridium kluyveri DSM 555]EDK35230.1 Hypothetical protein CKL_3227 [Clostridium kluyveri DSM 555]BAH07908.1 hypothetical protein CKR_2857 [Clostridium kluyveri NBRC 12016]